MKKVVAYEYKPTMKTSKDTYLDDCMKVKENLDARLQDAVDRTRKTNDLLDSLKGVLEGVDTDIYWYDADGTTLDAPEDFDWSNTVDDKMLDKYYDAYDEAWETGKKLVEYLEYLEKLRSCLKEFDFDIF